MKNLFLSGMLLCLALIAYSNPSFNCLAEVNKQWLLQKDIHSLNYPEYKMRTDREWIRIHLSLVEQTLRSRSTVNLSEQQKANRLKALDYLHQYWQSGAFPINDLYTYRTPIFIDRYDNFCAVGYLVKATGFESVSRKISKETNLAYVKDMKHPELFAWAKEYGFSVDELAWIQPGYGGPLCETGKIGKGVDGEVLELYADNTAGKLYVGGRYITADSSFTANNIAYVTEVSGAYQWHQMGTGVNGDVNAIAVYGSDVFVAGSFDTAGGIVAWNVAKWNGTSWSNAGCLNGTVKDLIVYKGDLYAAGQFVLCPSSAGVNFAKWNGSVWQPLSGLTGMVNTMQVIDTILYLGGNFTHSSGAKNIIKWTPGVGFSTTGSNLNNEVTDIEVLSDTIYATCNWNNNTSDNTVFSRLVTGTWTTIRNANNLAAFNFTKSYNTMCEHEDVFMIGGDFKQMTVPNPSFVNWQQRYAANISDPNSLIQRNNYFMTDSTINKIVVFNNKMVFGGVFKYGNSSNALNVPLNGIGYRFSYYYPTPVDARLKTLNAGCDNPGATASVTISGGAPPYRYLWSNGDTTAAASKLKYGNNTVIVTDKMGKKDTVAFFVNTVVIDKIVFKYGDSLVANQSAGTYQWLDCSTGLSVISGAAGKYYVPEESGSYAVAISYNGCMDTSVCESIVPSGIEELKQASLQIVPNPANNIVTITSGEKMNNVKIVDVTGRVVVAKSINATTAVIDIKRLHPGVYTVFAETDNEKPITTKLVVQ